MRTIDDKPRVTRYTIDWDTPNPELIAPVVTVSRAFPVRGATRNPLPPPLSFALGCKPTAFRHPFASLRAAPVPFSRASVPPQEESLIKDVSFGGHSGAMEADADAPASTDDAADNDEADVDGADDVDVMEEA
jgi:hypothetical protein